MYFHVFYLFLFICLFFIYCCYFDLHMAKFRTLVGKNQHTPMICIPPRPITLILEMKPVLTKEEVTQLWRDKEKEQKRSQHYKGNILLIKFKDIQRQLKNGEKIPHRQQWVGKLPEFPIYGDREESFQADCMFMLHTKGYVGCLCLISDN